MHFGWIKCRIGHFPAGIRGFAIDDSSVITYWGSAGVAIYEEKKSNQENIECSGRGICDRTTGTCRCHFGFTSSDGNGASGSRGDCGYYTEHQDLEGYPAASTRI